MGVKIKLHDNYLEYCAARVSFRGKHNKTKALILHVVYNKPYISSWGIWAALGGVVSLGSVRATLTRLCRYGYVSNIAGLNECRLYRIRVKGIRFLYMAQNLAPLSEWLAQVKIAQVAPMAVRPV